MINIYQKSWLSALVAAIICTWLFHVAINSWVPLNALQINWHYYSPNLFDRIRTRALAGTMAHTLGISLHGFIDFIQCFKIAWIFLLSLSVFRAINGWFLPLIFCVLFVFNSLIYINNAIGGFVDIIASFWLLIAALMMLYAARFNRIKTMLMSALIPLFLSIMTHEKSIFIIMPMMAWCLIKYGKKTWPTIALFLCFSIGYIYITRDLNTFGHTPLRYLDIFMQNGFKYLKRSFSMFGIFTSIGMLWVIYLIMGYRIISIMKRYQKLPYIGFLAFSIFANILPLLIAGDTQRMTHGMWIVVYMIIIGERNYFNNNKIKIHPFMLSIITLLHLLIPPYFVYGQKAVPLNCYARKVTPYILDKRKYDIWMPISFSENKAKVDCAFVDWVSKPFTSSYDLEKQTISGSPKQVCSTIYTHIIHKPLIRYLGTENPMFKQFFSTFQQ